KDVALLGVEGAAERDVEECGVLGLAVRSRQTLRGGVISWLASWNEWMWTYGNSAYLRGLLVLAILLAVLRGLLMFVSSYMAARATIEPAPGLGGAFSPHPFRLGTLAFRALGPSGAVSASTRHLESVHDALYAWLTVVFREPVKFGLLLAFALLVNFWLSLA